MRIIAAFSDPSDEGRRVHELIEKLAARLSPVFPYERKENIQFELGCNEGVSELFLFHLNRRPLRMDQERLLARMPESQHGNWIVRIEP